jgi:hypothetical protein
MPNDRGLVQHGGRPGWLGESDLLSSKSLFCSKKRQKLIIGPVILSIWLYAGALVIPSSLDLFGTFGYHRYQYTTV